ncbi:MAG: hypothetical protein ABF379_10185 [Akkermansiaceae bacterium]
MAGFTKKEPAAYVNTTHTVIAGNFHSGVNLEALESIVKKVGRWSLSVEEFAESDIKLRLDL